MAKTRRRKVDPAERPSNQMIEVLRWAFTYKLPEPAAPSDDSLTQLVNTRFVPRKPSEFIGEDPSPSKRTTLSNTLKRDCKVVLGYGEP
jgi:hypothetical protein